MKRVVTLSRRCGSTRHFAEWIHIKLKRFLLVRANFAHVIFAYAIFHFVSVLLSIRKTSQSESEKLIRYCKKQRMMFRAWLKGDALTKGWLKTPTPVNSYKIPVRQIPFAWKRTTVLFTTSMQFPVNYCVCMYMNATVLQKNLWLHRSCHCVP